jgi:hypothetical protein
LTLAALGDLKELQVGCGDLAVDVGLGGLSLLLEVHLLTPMVEDGRNVLTFIKGRSEDKSWNERDDSINSTPTTATLLCQAIVVGVGARMRPCRELAVVAHWWLFVIWILGSKRGEVVLCHWWLLVSHWLMYSKANLNWCQLMSSVI